MVVVRRSRVKILVAYDSYVLAVDVLDDIECVVKDGNSSGAVIRGSLTVEVNRDSPEHGFRCGVGVWFEKCCLLTDYYKSEDPVGKALSRVTLDYFCVVQ